VAVTIPFIAVNVKAQSASNLARSGIGKSQVSWQKVDKFAVVAGNLGISDESAIAQGMGRFG
jgi:hypothetical protein